MFQLLIVDDEPTIRKGLSHFIQWESFDCQVAATACDGREAIDIIVKAPPDIVITDIKMPQVDGIELSRFLFENYPEIKIIMLTGYADFAYAQSAVKYQVTDFIVKPTSKVKLIEAIKNAQALIAREKRSAAYPIDTSVLVEQLFAELTNNPDKEAGFREQMKNLAVSLSYFVLAAFRIPDGHGTFLPEQYEFISNILSQQGTGNYCYRYHQDLLIIIYRTAGMCLTIPEQVMKNCAEIVSMIASIYGVSLSTGISRCHCGPAELGIACAQAVSALSLNFYTENAVSVYHENNDEISLDIKSEYLMTLYDIEKLLRNWDFEPLHPMMKKLFSNLRNNFVKSADIKSICLQIYYICSRLLIKKQLIPPTPEIIDEISASTSIFQLERLMDGFIETVRSMLTKEGKNLSAVVEKAVLYINQNLSGSLSLESIAGYAHVNPSHLSRTFKKEYGIALTEYINKARIEKAQEILSFSNTLSYEAAEKVGFNDAAYFSMIFKKYTGLTPKEFKQIHSIKAD